MMWVMLQNRSVPALLWPLHAHDAVSAIGLPRCGCIAVLLLSWWTAELTAMCRDSHVEQPEGLQEALVAINSEARNPGAAAELLAKLLHMLAEVQVR